MAKGKKPKKPKAKRAEKFFLGFNRVIRDLLRAQAKVERSITVGRKRVAQSKGDPVVLQANRHSLQGSRAAKRIVAAALRQLNDCPCLDQFMNCDPEYFRVSTKAAGQR